MAERLHAPTDGVGAYEVRGFSAERLILGLDAAGEYPRWNLTVPMKSRRAGHVGYATIFQPAPGHWQLHIYLHEQQGSQRSVYIGDRFAPTPSGEFVAAPLGPNNLGGAPVTVVPWGGLSVVVLSKDRPDLFKACAQSVPDRPYLAEKVLVHNGTDAETPELARAMGWRVIEPGRNLSFSAGNNLAVRSLPPGNTHLLLLNNDAVLHEGALDALWSARAGADVVGSFILDPGGLVDHAGIHFDDALNADHLGHGFPVGHFPAGVDITNLPAVTFACVLASRAMWDVLGGLDESYSYCCEDSDYCLRVREAGGTVMVARDAVVTHAASSTRDPHATAIVAEEIFSARWRKGGRLLRVLGTPTKGGAS